MASCGGAFTFIALYLSLKLASQGTAEPLVPAVFVFGDSMVDVGNNNFIEKCNISCKANYPHFGIDYPCHSATGRFSNGYNMADRLAQLLNFDESPPPFLSMSNASLIRRMSTGISFASGGLGLLDITGNGPVCTQVFSMTEQVGNFINLARMWGHADLISKSLVFISTGSNDMFEYAFNSSDHNGNDTEFLQSLVASYTTFLKDLYGAGAKKFSMVSPSLVGCCPSQRAIAHDPKSPRIGGCCGGGPFGADGCNSSAPLCRNRSNHLFWDDYHPSDAVTEITAKMIFGDTTGLFVHPINVQKLVEL